MPGMMVLAFLQAGTNEVVAIPAFILTAVLLIMLLRRKSSQWYWAALSLIAILTGIFLQIVLSDAPRSHRVVHLNPAWELVMKGLQTHALYVFGWFRNAPLLAAIFVSLHMMSRCVKQESIFVFANKRSLLFLILLSTVIIIGVLAAYPVFNKDPYIPKRIENIAYLWWLLSIVAIVFATVQYLWLRYKFSFDKLPVFLIVAILLFIAGKIFSVNTKVGLAWKVLANGQAKVYKSENRQRFERMHYYQSVEHQDTVLIPPINQPIELIFYEDLYGYIPNDGNNQAFAAYFGLKAVKISTQ